MNSRLKFLVVLFFLLAACGKAITPVVETPYLPSTPSSTPHAIEPPTIVPTERPTKFPIPAVIIRPGPFQGTETPIAITNVPYPTIFTEPALIELLSRSYDASALTSDAIIGADIKSIIKTNETWCAAAGSSCPNVPISVLYNDTDPRYITAQLDSNGHVVSWMWFMDEYGNKQWAESPMWDPHWQALYAQDGSLTTQDIVSAIDLGNIGFGLPDKSNPQNHFELVMTKQGGYPILVEVDKDGKPIRWLNAATDSLASVAKIYSFSEVHQGSPDTDADFTKLDSMPTLIDMN